MRYTRKTGGALIGKGTIGIVYDLCESESLCSINPDDIKDITLYTTTGKEKESNPSDFFKELTKIKGRIVKIFMRTDKNKTNEQLKHKMEEELKQNRTIVNLYGDKSSDFLTLDPISYKDKRVLGIIIKKHNGQKLFAIFGSKCNNNYSVDIDKIIEQILESIVILQKNKYQHNDIKVKNIVFCADRYKLIDWGFASSIHTIQIGADIITSPVKMYISGLPKKEAEKILMIRNMVKNKEYASSNMFVENYERIVEQFKNQTDSRKDLLTKFKYSFDTFMLGQTVLRLVYENKLDYKKYKPMIELLTNIEHPCRAEEALMFFRRNF